MREQVCLKCAIPGDLARNWTRKDGPKTFNGQARGWQAIKCPASWESEPEIREKDVEQEPEQSGNDECPQ